VLFGLDVEFGSFAANMRENARRMRAQITKYVQDRKSGLTKSKMSNCDLMAIFLED